jgi:hypothetical protein
MAKKFPLGSVRKLAYEVRSMHDCLTNLLSDYDNEVEDDGLSNPSNPNPRVAGEVRNRAAKDDSDAGAPYAQGQDASVVVAAVRAAIAAERDAPVPMSEGIPGLSRKLTLY